MTAVARAALFAVLLAAPAAAQGVSASAFPLEVGNRWEYRVTQPQGVLRWEVVGDTTVAGERIARLQFGGSAVCGVRTVTQTTFPAMIFRLVDPSDPSAPCAAAPSTFPGGYAGAASAALGVVGDPSQQTVQIGSTAVTGGVWGNGVVVPEPGVHSQEVTRALDGIGLVELRRTFGGTGNPQTVVLRYELAYARIGGVEYGTAVAGEETPGAAAALSMGPNPARLASTLRFAATDRQTEAVLSDALGRVVLRMAVPAGATTATLDVSGLAPGVYVVGLGAASGRLVVVR